MLYKILKPFLNQGKDMPTLQKGVWIKFCKKAEKSPDELTKLEIFQLGRLTQKAIDHNNEYGGNDTQEETKFLEELQTTIKLALV